MAATEELVTPRAATIDDTGPIDVVGVGEAAARFRSAAVQLAGSDPDSDIARDAARQAAEALVALADGRNDGVLRRLLWPDPGAGEVTWTVACYQIGDLTPNALRDFADPAGAVDTVAGCGDASHVAAELLVSTTAGMRWTAVVRAGDVLTFQPPSARTASHASREVQGELGPAIDHWADQIRLWSGATPETGTGVDVDVDADVDVDGGPAAQLIPVAPEAGSATDVGLELVLDAVRRIERQEQQANADIVARLDTIDRRMGEIEAAVVAGSQSRVVPIGESTMARSGRDALVQVAAALRGLAERTRCRVREMACSSGH